MNNDRLNEKINYLEGKIDILERKLSASPPKIFSRSRVITGVVLSVIITSFILYGAVTKPHTFMPGKTISSGEMNENFDALYEGVNANSSRMDLISAPVGAIIAWHKNVGGGIPSLPDNWVECNGGTVDDSDSPIAGQAIPDLNIDVGGNGDGGRFLRGNGISGLYQEDEFKSHSHPFNITTNMDDERHNGEYGPIQGSGDTNTGLTGGDETRPVNMSVVWIMRVK